MATYDFERYPNIRSAGSPSFGPDGERLSFLMNATGVAQVWRLDGPGEWPRQLTFEDERVSFAEWSPERPELVVGMDRGGNEFTQFFLLDGDGETTTPLTGTPEAIHNWGAWSTDGSRFAFTANRRDRSAFDVYVQGRDESGDEAELVAAGDGRLSVAGWSPDDDRLALVEAHSSADGDVYVLDVGSGDRRHVTPHEGDVRYDDVSWGPAGGALYLTTDEDADTTYLARLDLDSGDVETVVEGGRWNVERLCLDPATGRLAYGRNVEGYTELTVGELEDGTAVREFPAPDLPRGVYKAPTFGPDADRLAVAVTGRSENENVHVVDVATGAVARWTDATTAGIPKESFVEPELVRYESFDGLEVPAFFSLPADAEPGGTPVVVDVHGGPESQRRPFFRAVAQYFLHSGYAVFEPNVRGSSGYGREYSHLDDGRNRMDAVADVERGVAWLRDQRPVDPDRVVAFGGSYGGFVVLSALTEHPDLWAAGVDLMGIANLVTFLENTGEWRREHREAEYGSLDEDREFLEAISPTNNVEHIESPLLVVHGANDPRVPVGEAERIAAAAADQGVPVEKLVFDDEGHGLTKRDNLVAAYTAVAAFLDEHV